MFPLDFTIEAEDMTLTPDNSKPNNNLPVISGKSISDHDGYAGKTAFQFRKTITWDEYIKLTPYVDSEESSWRVVNCYFKTNRAVSAPHNPASGHSMAMLSTNKPVPADLVASIAKTISSFKASALEF